MIKKDNVNEIQKRNESLEAALTPIDYRFINYCRELKYAEVKLFIGGGKPIIVKEGLRTRQTNINDLPDILMDLFNHAKQEGIELKLKINPNGKVTLYEIEKKRVFNKIL